MSIQTSNVTGSSGSGVPPAATGSTNLGKNEFLKLLMAQLQQQDPLSPTDSQAFVAQLAQFTQVQTAQQMSDQLNSLLVASAANNEIQSASLAGKTVLYRTNSVDLGSSIPVSLEANLKGDAKSVTWTVTDSTGKVVRTLKEGDAATGDVTQSWDGRDDNGAPLPAGNYKVSVTALDGNAKVVDSILEGRGQVTAVSFENSYPQLVIGSQTIKMSDVVRVLGNTTT
jgi:flagellar basal-body rod modification protein FlgD